MILNITEQQALQMAANAVNASRAVGMGLMHHEDKDYTADDMRRCLDPNGDIDIDYFQGRMTKLFISRSNDGYEVTDSKPRPEYQSWARKYPTYASLAATVMDDPLAPQQFKQASGK